MISSALVPTRDAQLTPVLGVKSADARGFRPIRPAQLSSTQKPADSGHATQTIDQPSSQTSSTNHPVQSPPAGFDPRGTSGRATSLRKLPGHASSRAQAAGPREQSSASCGHASCRARAVERERSYHARAEATGQQLGLAAFCRVRRICI